MRISDWSSDVCSSDLCAWPGLFYRVALPLHFLRRANTQQFQAIDQHLPRGSTQAQAGVTQGFIGNQHRMRVVDREIGRASCREREGQYVWNSVGGESFKNKKNYTIRNY